MIIDVSYISVIITAIEDFMSEEKKVETSTTAVEEGKSVTPTVEGGEKVTQPKNEENQPFKVFKTQTDYDNEAAYIKGSVERKFLKELGIKDKADLEKVKLAYVASLTQEEKNAQALAELEEIKKQNSRKDFIIGALAKNSNEAIEDVGKQVTMAESLLTAGIYSTFEEAFDYVRGLRGVQQPQPSVPQGKNITQPDTPTQPVKNPFKKGTKDYSLQAQTDLYKKDPELARKLAKEVGITL